MTTVTLHGWDAFMQKLSQLPEAVKEEADGYVMDAALLWVQLAASSAPKDKGFLSRDIRELKVTEMHWDVTSGRYYSPYMEWGTGSRAVVPAELADYASQWWTKKQHVGIHPHPYFFMHVKAVEAQLNDDLTKLVNTEH